MPFVEKNWQDYPATNTKRGAAAMKAMERRPANYAGQAGHVGPGTADYESFRVKQRGFGADMSVDVGLGGVLNAIYVPVDGGGGVQRYEYIGGLLNVAIGANASGNPRVDRIIGEAPTDPDSLPPNITVLQGTPNAAATLDNPAGAAAVSSSRVLLADVLVASGVGSILTAAIRDRRADALLGIPWFATGRDQVQLQAMTLQQTHQGITPTTHDNMQAAALMWLPRRIVGATRIRWRYRQGATPATSNYQIGIYDASGRIIQNTGIVAFTGAANSYQERAETIAATTFEAGWYYVLWGLAAITAASAVTFPGISMPLASGQIGPVVRNQSFRSASGGTTIPTTMAALTDIASLTADTATPNVPQIALAVG